MKKLQNTLYITRDGAYLHKQRETLLIEQTIDGQKQKLMQVPIHSVGAIFCFGHVMVSPALMGFCGERGTTLAFFNTYGKFLGRLVGQQSGNVLLRRSQFEVCKSRKIDISRNIVAAKVQSSRAVLQRFLRNHGDSQLVAKASTRLKQIIEALTIQTDIEKVRGLEGEAASHYFRAFPNLIKVEQKGMQFNGRSRRPPKDPINAMLSFLYSILGKEVSGALQGVGLDPQVGFLHEERPGRDSLAQDLLEEFRAYIVDRVVLTLVNRKQVKEKDFVVGSLGGITMKDDTRKLLLQAYQAKKQEELTHPFLKEKIQIGLLPYVQAMLLARHIRGDLEQYPPFYSK